MKKVKLIALLAAAATGLLLYFYLSRAAKPPEIETTSVVRAAVDIARNTVVTADMLQAVSIPTDAVLPDTLRKTADAVGKVTNSEVLAGEQLLSRRLVDAVTDQEGGSLSYAVSSGMRAVTIAVTETSGLYGLVKPGNHVDIAVLCEAEFDTKGLSEAGQAIDQKTTKMTSQILLQNVEVLAVDGTMDQAGAKELYKTVTVQLSPDDALRLELAQSVGTVSLLLRSPIDASSAETQNYNADILKPAG
jgi:pilus assembly protein CpaB